MKKIILATFALLLLGGCDSIHRFPDGEGVNPYIVDVTLDIAIDMNFEGEISPQTYATYASMLEGDYDIRYMVEIYAANANKNSDLTDRVAKIVRTSNSVIAEGLYRIVEQMELPADDYVVLAWVDFVKKSDGSGDLYYKTDKLTSVSILDPEGSGHGYDTTKDAFCGSVEMKLSQYRGQRFVHHPATCPVRRPFAMYRVITTDVEEYFAYSSSPYSSVRPAKTHVDYLSFFPKGYNVQFEEPGVFTTVGGYDFDIADTAGEQEALVASDFVLVSEDAYYFTDLEIRDASARRISAVKDLKINLKRNMITVIRGEFLTKEHSGGVGIDERFGEEIIIRID